MFPHFARNVSYNLMAVLEFNLELRARQSLHDNTLQLDNFLIFGHKDITSVKYSKLNYNL